jgi:hypothetical protein
MERELFLRGKMYEIHLFIVKLIVTFSSSVLAFSIGMLNLFEDTNIIECGVLIVVGWVFSITAIALIVIALMLGLNLTYTFYNNILNSKAEITEDTSNTETNVHGFVISSAVCSVAGAIFILVFSYINFL